MIDCKAFVSTKSIHMAKKPVFNSARHIFSCYIMNTHYSFEISIYYDWCAFIYNFLIFNFRVIYILLIDKFILF
jgi:hypothetical protein